MTYTTTAPVRDTTCSECNRLFETPAVGVCPYCRSRQIRKANALELFAWTVIAVGQDAPERMRRLAVEIRPELPDHAVELELMALRIESTATECA